MAARALLHQPEWQRGAAGNKARDLGRSGWLGVKVCATGARRGAQTSSPDPAVLDTSTDKLDIPELPASRFCSQAHFARKRLAQRPCHSPSL